MSVDKVHVMVDIETLDVIPSAVILSMGAAVITDSLTPMTFYIELDANDQYERTKSQSTIDWWSKQIDGLMPKGETNIAAGLLKFSTWISSLRADPIIWCKGTDFDTAILSHAYNQYKLTVPWKYNSVRDFRTVKKLFPSYNFPANPHAHDALADAKHQAEELKAILKANPNLTLS